MGYYWRWRCVIINIVGSMQLTLINSYSLSGLQPIQSTPVPVCKSSARPSEPEVNHSSVVDPSPFNDKGASLDPEKSLHEICDLASNLSVDEKCFLLYNHIAPPAVVPPRFADGYQHRFKHIWLEKYPWLINSSKLDGVFCGPCALLLPSRMNRSYKGIDCEQVHL